MSSTLRIALVVLAVGGGAARSAARVEDPDGAPSVRESVAANVYTLEGGFDVGAQPSVAWDVLTDYGHMPRFVPSVLTSTAESLGDGGQLVTQALEGKAFLFSRRVLVRLVVQEQAESHIAFHDTSLQDFASYQGSWDLQAIPGGTRIEYALRAEPHSDYPAFIASGAFKSTALEMLSQLHDEMLRRAAVQALSRPMDTPSKGKRP